MSDRRKVTHNNTDGSKTTWENVPREQADSLLDKAMTDPTVSSGHDEPVVRDVVIPED